MFRVTRLSRRTTREECVTTPLGNYVAILIRALHRRAGDALGLRAGDCGEDGYAPEPWRDL